MTLNQDSAEFVEALAEEVAVLLDKLRADDIQPIRRALCRSVFQFVDGTASFLMQSVAIFESPEMIGEDAFLALLGKKKIIQAGKETIVPNRPGFARSLYFAFDTFGWTAGINIDLKADNKAWARFRRCISIRNRVTHPNTLGDLCISGRELDEIVETFFWLKDSLLVAHRRVAVSFLNQANAMEARWIARIGIAGDC
jgi:hypothetical protein